MTDREQLRDRMIRRALAAHLMGLLDHATLAAITPAHRTYQDMGRVIDALGVVEMAEELGEREG